jgi:ribosomal protein S18 acetylase RimI-like enzyme
VAVLRFRRELFQVEPEPEWPRGAALAPLPTQDIAALHHLLVEGYRTGFGDVPADAQRWWQGLQADAEFDPALVFVAVDTDSRPIGIAQCWTSGFVKDLAVAKDWRGRGVGEALLRAAFLAFSLRGAAAVELKVHSDNHAAIRLYRRVGMVEAPL